MNYKRLMKQYHIDMVDALRRYILIPSVYDEKTVSKTCPFGKNVNDALEYAAKLGERYGYEIDKCDGYATEITIGDGDKMIGIFAHADVVPASGKWTYGPFDPKIEHGRMYGRGTSDDKGPFIAAFYAAKALKDAGLLHDCKVRIVVGGDEERGSGCLEHYFHVLKKPDPLYGFTPDSDFPLIYGEKGMYFATSQLDISIPHVISISGGVATNAVCDKVEIKLDDAKLITSYLKENAIKFDEKDNLVTIYGKSCHGSTPQFGDNAALKTLKVLGNVFKLEKLTLIADKLSDTSGKSFDGYYKTKLLGESTYCVGIISYENGLLKFTVNCRYPEDVNGEKVNKHFDEYFGTKSKIEGVSPVLLYNPDSKLVKTLLKAYRAETLDFSKPLTTGGGTYAKHCKNTIAFGAMFPHRESRMHEPDEYILLKDFFKSAEIYAHAIDLLRKLD